MRARLSGSIVLDGCISDTTPAVESRVVNDDPRPLPPAISDQLVQDWLQAADDEESSGDNSAVVVDLTCSHDRRGRGSIRQPFAIRQETKRVRRANKKNRQRALKQLQEMGWPNSKSNRNLVRMYNGDVSRIISTLLDGSQSPLIIASSHTGRESDASVDSKGEVNSPGTSSDDEVLVPSKPPPIHAYLDQLPRPRRPHCCLAVIIFHTHTCQGRQR